MNWEKIIFTHQYSLIFEIAVLKTIRYGKIKKKQTGED